MTKADLLTEVVDEVFRLAGSLSRAGDELTAPQQLTAARWLVLGGLRDEPGTMADLARRRGLARQSVRESMQKLEGDGLVRREPDPLDARAPRFALTRRGEAALEAIEPRRAHWATATATPLRADALRATLHTLQALRLTLDA